MVTDEKNDKKRPKQKQNQKPKPDKQNQNQNQIQESLTMDSNGTQRKLRKKSKPKFQEDVDKTAKNKPKSETRPDKQNQNQIQESLIKDSRGTQLTRSDKEGKSKFQKDVDETAKNKPKSEARPEPSLRFDRHDHLPLIDKSRLVRCKLEKCNGKKTYVFCPKCDVHLCFNVALDRNCFKEFHEI